MTWLSHVQTLCDVIVRDYLVASNRDSLDISAILVHPIMCQCGLRFHSCHSDCKNYKKHYCFIIRCNYYLSNCFCCCFNAALCFLFWLMVKLHVTFLSLQQEVISKCTDVYGGGGAFCEVKSLSSICDFQVYIYRSVSTLEMFWKLLGNCIMYFFCISSLLCVLIKFCCCSNYIFKMYP